MTPRAAALMAFVGGLSALATGPLAKAPALSSCDSLATAPLPESERALRALQCVEAAAPGADTLAQRLPVWIEALPDLGARTWREAAEKALSQGQPAAGGVLLLRAVASDSLQRGLAQYRLSEALRARASEGLSAPSGSPLGPLPGFVKPWLAEAKWQTAVTWETLEAVFWSAGAQDTALLCLTRRLAIRKTPRHFPAWWAAAQRLHAAARPAEALAALERADLGTAPTAKDLANALTLAFKAALASGRTRTAAGWATRLAPSETGPAARRLRETPLPFDLRLQAATWALRDGRLDVAGSWLGTEAWSGPSEERRQLLLARLSVGRGRPAEAMARLQRLKDAPNRKLENGALLHAQGWAAALAGQWEAADSLLTAASAYVDAPEAQSALELRRLLAIDTVGLARLLRAHPDAPFAVDEKRKALAQWPAGSPFSPEARMWEASYALGEGHPEEARKALEALIALPRNAKSAAAKVLLAHLNETNAPDRAIAEFEDLLVESQQGVPAEYARERLRAMGR